MPRPLHITEGDRFGKLVFVERVGYSGNKKKTVLIKCLCDCGKEKITTVGAVKSGSCYSCGCEKRIFDTNDYTGVSFNRLTVIDKPIKKDTHYYYPCVCECGKKKNVRLNHLKLGMVTSCGCIKDPTNNAFYRKMQKLIGQKFNKITVTGIKREDKITLLEYQCECGKIGMTNYTTLKQIISCGCTINATYLGCNQVSGTYLSSLRYGARSRNLVFELSAEDVWGVYLKQDKKCALTGEEVVFNRRYYKDYSTQTASVDRIDPSKGYTKDNIQIVHKDINMIKNNYSQEEFIDICLKVANYYKKGTV